MEVVPHESNKTGPPPNYFSRRQQLRLLFLVMSLGLVLVLINEARDPRNWYWLTGEQDTASTETSAEKIDTSYYPPPPAAESEEAIRIVPNFDPLEDEGARFFPGVEPAYLAEVRDNSPIHNHRAWYNLLGVLKANESEIINKSSTGPVTFGQLFEQPKV